LIYQNISTIHWLYENKDIPYIYHTTTTMTVPT